VVVVKAVDVDSPDPSVVALDDWMVSERWGKHEGPIFLQGFGGDVLKLAFF